MKLKFQPLLISICLLFTMSDPQKAYSKEGGYKNYYELFGISKNASQNDIQKAFRRMAQRYHPDRLGPDATEEEKRVANEKMSELNKAYEVLKDPAKRKQYDDFGHESFTEFGETKDHSDKFSETFNNIYTKRKSSQDQGSSSPQKQFSEKALYLFYLILINNWPSSANTKLAKKALKQLLTETGMPSLSKNTLERILRDFYINFSAEQRQRILNTLRNPPASQSNKGFAPSHLMKRESILQSALDSFIQQTEERYVVSEITSKERRAIDLFHKLSLFNQNPENYIRQRANHLDLLEKQNKNQALKDKEKLELRAFEKQDRKDIAVFRQILSALGLPGQVHHDFLLRSYLDGLKQSLWDKHGLSEKGKLLAFKGSGHRTIHMEDRQIMEALRQIKFTFDEVHYRNLEIMSNPFKANFLKNFPAQFIIFQAAIGASLYRQSLTDPYIYGADRNPEMLSETAKHTLSPTGALSFFIFVAVSQQIHYRLYGLGRFMDGKTLKTRLGKISFDGKMGRAIAPGAGLGMGFFVSSLFDELLHDPHLQQCAKQLYSEKTVSFMDSSKDDLSATSGQSKAHVDPCEGFYLNWISSEKWKHYAVDIATLIGSGLLSHKVLTYLLRALRSTAVGSYALIRAGKLVGLRFAGWIGFFSHMFLFMEFHKLLDAFIGQPLKEQLTAGGIKDDLIHWTQTLNTEISTLPLWYSSPDQFDASSNTLPDPFKQKISDMEMTIKELGHKFQKWTNVRGQFHSQSARLWTQQVNKLLLPYEGSADFLKGLFILSHFNQGLEIKSQIEHTWDSEKEISKKEKDWIEYNDLNQPISFDMQKMLKKKELFKKYCPQITEDLPVWSAFCEEADFYIPKKYYPDLFFETAFLIGSHLHSLPLEQTSINNNNFMSYIGKSLNEMFSSDPSRSVQNLSHDEKFQLSRILIITSTTSDNILSLFSPSEISHFKQAQCSNFFPYHKTDEEEAELYGLCLHPLQNQKEIENICRELFPTEDENLTEYYNACLTDFNLPEQDLTEKLRFKLLSAGIYLLKELKAQNGGPQYFYIKDSHHALPLFDLLKVYKKGEKYLLLPEDEWEIQKESLDSAQIEYMENMMRLSSNFYSFMEGLICGEEKSPPLFSIPPFFEDENIKIYNFHSNQFEALSSVCGKFDFFSRRRVEDQMLFHDVLFNRPAQAQGQTYETLYLTLENILRTNYSSSKDLMRHFQKISQAQLDEIGDQLSSDLNFITENYYKGAINSQSEIKQDSNLSDFLNYYHKDKILFDIRSFTGNFKGLEISLFQVNYWMNTLKHILSVGDQKLREEQSNLGGKKSLNHVFFDWEGLNKSAFEKMQIEILSLLQSYHDSYKKEQGPYLLFPNKDFIEKINAIFQKEGKEGLQEAFGGNGTRFTILQEKHKGTPLPVMTAPDIILSHILNVSIPPWDSPHQISYIQKNSTIFQKGSWKALIYSVVFELNKSLNNFFMQLQSLQMKESFENSLSVSE